MYNRSTLYFYCVYCFGLQLVFAIDGLESRRKLQLELDSGAEIRIRAPSTPPTTASNGFKPLEPLPERVIEVFGTSRQNHVAKYLMQLW